MPDIRDVLVTGVGVAPMRRAAGKPFWDVAHEAAKAALADAGLQKGDLDSVVLSGLDLECGRTISNMYVAPAAGGYLKDEIRVAEDGLFAAALGWMRVRSGLFDTTMVLAYGQSSETSPDRLADLVHDPIYVRDLHPGRVAPLAMQAAAYRAAGDAGAIDDAADAVAATNRAAGVANPATLREAAPSREAVRGAPWVAHPLREPHVPVQCDGAAAIILQSEVHAQRSLRPAARLNGFGWASESGNLGHRDLASGDSTRRAANMAYQQTGLSPSDVALAEVHDATAYHQLLAMDALGLSASANGSLPVNTSGGSLSGEPSAAAGMYRLAWCVEAATGRGPGARGGSAVSGPVLAHATGGPAAQAACVGILEAWS